jgi:hypothetical protein
MNLADVAKQVEHTSTQFTLELYDHVSKIVNKNINQLQRDNLTKVGFHLSNE